MTVVAVSASDGFFTSLRSAQNDLSWTVRAASDL
jgi:hypothetical protein